MCRKQRANNAFARCLVDNLAVMQDSESLTIFMEHVKTCSHLAGILSILKTIVFVFTFLISRSAEPPELSPLSFGGDILNEGDFAQASCIVRKGDQPLAISWSFHGSNITSELGIVITPLGVRGSSLMIPSVGFSHTLWVSGPIAPTGRRAKWLNRAESSQIWSFNAAPQ